MRQKGRIIFSEENIVSLRTAIVLEDDDIISLFLTPPPHRLAASGTRNYARHDYVWLYRRKQSFFAEVLIHLRRSVKRNIKAKSFAKIPRMGFKWSDSGDSVAIFFDGIPWAFINENKDRGFSKGVLKSAVVNPWNQELFETLFQCDRRA